MIHLFVVWIYQPFFNLLVFLYWLLDKVSNGNADMGVAVIILTIIIRVLLLPLSFNGEKTEKDRREIARAVAEVEQKYKTEPVKMKDARRKVLQKSRLVIAGELFVFFIQLAIALMLYRIFQSGLTGEDIHLLYSFMPEVNADFNLVFWGKFDLTHPSLTLNLVQSICIFVLETLALYYSPYPVTKTEVVRMQLVYPVVAFVIFLGLPAGKKLFIITTLIISIILLIVKIVRWKFEAYTAKQEEKAAEDGIEKIVVEVK